MTTTKTEITQPKWIAKSTTFWGALISFATVGLSTVGPILDAVGVTIPVTPADIEAASNTGTLAIQAAGAVVGLFATIFGRWKAGKTAQPVSMLPNAPATTLEVAKPPSGVTGKSSG